MQPNLLLMCKLLFLLLVAHGFQNYISDPFIPFLRPLDYVQDFPNYFKIAIKSIFLGSGILLLFNIKPRTMAIILGCSLFTVLLASKSLFRNHYFICGCALLLAGLTNKKDFPWLLFVQLSLLYFGAVFNKVFEPDWWSGQFMHNWLVNSRENEFFIRVSGFLPDMWFAKILSWSSMLIELCIAVLLLIRKKHLLAVWMIILFHSLLYTMTLFRFGHFFEDIVIILLVFLIWPKTKMIVYINQNFNSIFKRMINFYFLNSKIIYQDKISTDNYWLKVESGESILFNHKALRHLLKFTPNFYISLFIFDQLIRFLFNGTLMHTIQIIVLWIVAFYFIPKKLRRKNSYNLIVNENRY